MKKILVLAIALLMVGLNVVSAQVPLPPLPNITLAMPPHPRGGTYNYDVTPAMLRRLLEIRDQRCYLQYLLNSEYITRDEYRNRDLPLEQAEADLIVPIIQGDQIAYIYADGYIKKELDLLWHHASPGWPRAELIRERLGFVIQQPPGTRTTYFTHSDGSLVIYFSPPTDEVINNVRRQLEAGFGEAMKAGPLNDPNSPDYTYVLSANRAGSGRACLIELDKWTTPIIYLLLFH